MAVVTRRIKVNDHIELSTFYTLDSKHDVVCIDFKTLGVGGLGHLSFHAQLDRYAVQELIEALVDTLEGKADPEDVDVVAANGRAWDGEKRGAYPNE